MVIYLSDFHYFLLKLGRGFRMNQRDELLNLWVIVKFSIRSNIQLFEIFRDSHVTINWINGFNDIRVSMLDQWCKNIKSLLKYFTRYTFQHIYKELNTLADNLSKEALLIP